MTRDQLVAIITIGSALGIGLYLLGYSDGTSDCPTVKANTALRGETAVQDDMLLPTQS